MPLTIRSPLAMAAGLAAAAALSAAFAGGAGAQTPVDQFVSACSDGQGNPYLVTTCFLKGMSFEDSPALVAFHDTSDDSGHIPLATARQIGSAYGLAYHGTSATLYIGAFHKRGSHFGPAGPGGIYALDLSSGEIDTFAVVPGAGDDTHDASGDYFPDTTARSQAGRLSLGDLDLAPDGSELAVVNLLDRRIYRFRVPDGTLMDSFAHGAAGESWAAADARPFGLGYRGDRLYHGVVRSAESTQDPDELWAFVYESGWDGSQMRQVAATPLCYERGMYWPGEGNAIWQPWVDPPGSVHQFGRYAMPQLADITFAESSGDMYVAFRDRFGDQTFFTFAPQNPPPGETINNVPAGDVVPAFADGDSWRFQVDPEFFSGDYGPRRTGGHDETSFGGLVLLPGTNLLATTANSPQRINSAGTIWLSTASGDSMRREEIYAFGDQNFGKANGLGDLEVLCDILQQPTPTPTATDAPTATPTATATVTTAPSLTAPASATAPATGTATAPPGTTPREREATPPPPTPEELPRLPATGGGPATRWPALAGAAAALLATTWRLVRRVRRVA